MLSVALDVGFGVLLWHVAWRVCWLVVYSLFDEIVQRHRRPYSSSLCTTGCGRLVQIRRLMLVPVFRVHTERTRPAHSF